MHPHSLFRFSDDYSMAVFHPVPLYTFLFGNGLFLLCRLRVYTFHVRDVKLYCVYMPPFSASTPSSIATSRITKSCRLEHAGIPQILKDAKNTVGNLEWTCHESYRVFGTCLGDADSSMTPDRKRIPYDTGRPALITIQYDPPDFNLQRVD